MSYLRLPPDPHQPRWPEGALRCRSGPSWMPRSTAWFHTAKTGWLDNRIKAGIVLNPDPCPNPLWVSNNLSDKHPTERRHLVRAVDLGSVL